MSDIEQALAEALVTIDYEPGCADCGATVTYHAECPEGEGLLVWPDEASAAILATEPMQAIARQAAIDHRDAEEYRALMDDVREQAQRSGMVVSYIDVLARQAAIGAAVERLPDDFAWKVDYMPPPNEVAFFVYCYNRYGTGPTLPEAIAAALGDDDEATR